MAFYVFNETHMQALLALATGDSRLLRAIAHAHIVSDETMLLMIRAGKREMLDKIDNAETVLGHQPEIH